MKTIWKTKKQQTIPKKFQWKAFLIFIITLLVLFAGTTEILSRRTVTVTVEVDGQVTEEKTAKKTVKELLEENYSINSFDEVTPAPDTEVYDGEKIVVHKAKPVLLVDGCTSSFTFTQGETVREVLEEKGITLGEIDDVIPTLSTKVTDHFKIQILRNQVVIEEKLVPLAYQVEVKENRTKDSGYKNVLREGALGLKKETYEVIYQNGTVSGSSLVKETVLQDPVNKIVERGTQNTVVTAGGERISYTKELTMKSTAYCSCKKCCGKSPGDKGYGITRSGEKARRGIVAVDTKIIPLGTRLYVEGYGMAIAGDTGGAVKGNKIDLYMETHEQCLAYGRKEVKVYLLDQIQP